MTDQQNLANAIRALSMDAVQRAGCGHPGMPMGNGRHRASFVDQTS